MRTLRTQMINGLEPEICNKCYNKEKVNVISSRNFHNDRFPDSLARIPEITNQDGSVTEMKIKYWDFRFSNICNFKCRTCGPRYSSAWVPDSNKLLGISKQEKIWHLKKINNSPTDEFMSEQIDNVEKIYFAGGEPLLMDEHWKILELLSEKKKFNVELQYNTNASVLSYNKKNVLDYWSKWNPNKIFIYSSIDEIGDRAALIRSGTNWSEVEKNLISMSELKNIVIRPSITVSSMNVFRLPEIIQHLVDINIIKYKNFNINVVVTPNYHVSILPEYFRKQTIVKIQEFIADYNQRYRVNISEIFKYILHELVQPTNEKMQEEFITFNNRLDEIRNENIYETIPELNCLK
jgi:organic radical activating enzyme